MEATVQVVMKNTIDTFIDIFFSGIASKGLGERDARFIIGKTIYT